MNPGTGNTGRSAEETTLVAGLGSAHGDDRLGWDVIDRISAGLPEGVAACKLPGPLDLLDLLAGRERLILVDASAPSGTPGTVRRFIWPAPTLDDEAFLSTHGVGLVSTLRLAEALGVLPRHVTIFAIEAKRIGPAAGPAETTRPGVEAVAEAIRHDLRATDAVAPHRPGTGEDRRGEPGRDR